MTSVQYAVRFDDIDAPLLEVCDLGGFFVGRDSFDDYGVLLESESPRLTFSVVRPTPEVRLEELAGDIEVLVLDGEGEPMGFYSLWDARVISGDDPETLIVTAVTQLAPHVEARKLWDRFRVAEPQPGEWRAIPVGLREGWVEVAGLRHAGAATTTTNSLPRQEIVMEGDDIKDVASFFCAVGEAFHGPGGYLGCGFAAFEEHLEKYLGGVPARLIWRDMAVARSALSAVMEMSWGSVTKLEMILEIFAGKRVEVVTE